MSANDLLGYLLDIIFILLGIVTSADFLRRGGEIRRDVALLFNSPAVPVLVSLLNDLTGSETEWLNRASSLVLVAQPYLLLRLVQHLRSVPTIVARAAFAGMALSWVAVITIGETVSAAATLLVVAYFVGIDGYAMIAFVQGALKTTGVVRQRLRFAAAGSGLLALVLLIAGLGAALPSLEEVADSLIPVFAVASALAYYVGFAPPRWLRRAWQMNELGDYLKRVTAKPVGERLNVTESLSGLCQVASWAVGGTGAVVQHDETEQRWVLRYVLDQPELASLPLAQEGIIAQVWRDGAPAFLLHAEATQEQDRRLLEIVRAETLLVVPIATAERNWGLLLVFLRHHSLFVDDDLSLMALLAQQSAIFLENGVLIEQLRAYSEQLERRVEERTAELYELNAKLEQRVIERTIQLTAVNHELEAFSYSVSHDLRAPLRALDGFSQALLEDYSEQLDDDGKLYLNRIRQGSQRMATLIDDLLELSRITRMEMKHEDVNLSVLAQQIASELREQFPNHAVEFTVEDGMVVGGDPRLLRVALSNLLANAWKYTGKQPQPRVEFGMTEHNSQCAYFVRDNGAGFDMNYADKLFGVFQRLHSTSEFEGNGVGLATVQRVIRRHGGEVWAEAAVGQGATFYFSL